jgi:hypothetical protein
MKMSLLLILAAMSLISVSASAEIKLTGDRSDDPLVEALIKRKSPLTPQQQAAIEGYLVAERKALAPDIPLGATASAPEEIIDLTDGGKTQAVTLQLGYLTSLMVVGENGAPWPIRRARAGDDKVVKVNLVEDSGTLEMHPQKPWVNTNIILYLGDRNEPIKLYVSVSSDPADGVKDSLKLIVDGVPPGSAPLLQPNRVSIDHQLMNALGQSPGRNWTNLKVGQSENLPFAINYWLSPSRGDAIIRLRGASMVSPDWLTETRDPDGVTRVYRFRTPIPLMIRARDNAGIEYSIHLENPADILAGREGSNSMRVKRVSPERPPLDSALPFEEPLGLVGVDRVQRIAPSPTGIQETVRSYESFEGKGRRVQRVQIVTDLSLNKDTAARLIEESHRKPMPPITSESSKSKDVKVVAAPVEKHLTVNATQIPLSAVTTPGSTVSAAASAVVSTPISSGITFQVQSGGLYENLFRLTEQSNWKAPLWDLGENDRMVQGGYSVTGATPEEVMSKFLQPYADNYRFNVQISPLEKKIWLH